MPSMICAPQPLAVEAGARMLADGGNAFDAAIACVAVQWLVDPHSCGAGGYMVMTSFSAETGEANPIIDAPAVAGSGVSEGMWQDIVISPNPDGWGYFLQGKVNEDGYQSVCVPGIGRGLGLMHQKWCTRGWDQLLAAAIGFAEDGWVVGPLMASRWKEPAGFYEGSSSRQKLDVTPSAQQIYLKADGSTYEMHETLTNPDYAATLRRIAEVGPEDLHTGQLAETMATDLEAGGSWVTADDLANYEPRSEEPVTTNYKGYTIVSNQPPHGGPTLAAILNILGDQDLKSLGHNSPEYILTVSLAMKAAFADRNRHLADDRFADVPLEWMISADRAADWREVIAAGEEIDVGRQQADSGTTHVSVVDAQGNCVSLTHSLGTSSGVITPGLGFMYNNSMVNFDPYPGNPNSIAPRKGRTTGMTPTIVLRDGRPVLVLGAPGATRIITSVLQVILNHLEFGMSITDAVHVPRFDCQGDVIKCQRRIPESVCEQVRQSHDVVRIPRSHGGLALVHAVAINPESGELTGAADTGADGMALLVP
jgi:gamma-glutamyltranspeptidase/glutathione hydrolase